MNKINKYFNIILILLPLIICACSKEINIDTGDFVPRHVIEGYIENDNFAYVYITNNQDFFSTLNIDFSTEEGLETIKNLFISNALVIVDDDEIYDTLHFIIEPEVLQGKYLWPPVKYIGSKIVGEVGKKYNLTIEIDNKIYTSSTTITQPYIPDSIWVEVDPIIDTLCNIHVLIHDNPDEKNYYNCYVKRIGKDNYFSEALYCLWDDSYFNGKQFEYIIYRGFPSTLSFDKTDFSAIDNTGKFNVNDTVVLKVITMDYYTFRFWQTIENSNVVSTNIDGGALGVWSGFGVYYTPPIICKE